MKKCVATIKGKDRSILKQTSFNNNANGISAFAVTARNQYWPAKAVCESTGNYWILPYDILSGEGIDMKLANPKNTKVIAQVKLKDDKVGSEALSDLLRSDMISESYVPNNYYRDMRALVRGRLELVRAYGARTNRIRAILHKYPHKPKSCRAAIDTYNVDMRDTDRQLAESHWRVVDAINKEVDILESRIARMSLDDIRARRLVTIPGMGHTTAIAILAGVADHRRFPGAEKMASYAGLVPSRRNSGDVKEDGHITKTGSVWMRNAMVEAATTAVRYDARLKAKYGRLSARIGRMKARVAIARTMTEIVWHMLNDETEYRTRNEGLVKRKIQRIRRRAEQSAQGWTNPSMRGHNRPIYRGGDCALFS